MVGAPLCVTSRSAHIPLASFPPTSDAMRKLPAVDGLKAKVADPPGSRPRVGSGVDHPGWIGAESLLPRTTAQELGTVAWFSHCTVTCHPTGMLMTSVPSRYPL